MLYTINIYREQSRDGLQIQYALSLKYSALDVEDYCLLVGSYLVGNSVELVPALACGLTGAAAARQQTESHWL